MSALEGLELQLRQLEAMDRVDDDGEPMMVCKNCYSAADYCNCDDKALWPRDQVIIRLKSRLTGQDQEWI